jgi:hypothetical protein
MLKRAWQQPKWLDHAELENIRLLENGCQNGWS